MKMMFAVGRVTRGSTRVFVARQVAGTAAGQLAPDADASPEKRPEPGDFRAEVASPGTVH